MAPAERSSGDKNCNRSTPPSRMVSMAPIAPSRFRASRFQTRRQSVPSWDAVNPRRDPVSGVACTTLPVFDIVPTTCQSGRHTKGAATKTKAQGAIHHQLKPGLTEFSGSLTSVFARPAPTTYLFYRERLGLSGVVFHQRH